MRQHGYLQVEGGVLYWVRNSPSADEAAGKPPRCTLLFIHAAIADHTLWDRQVRYFNTCGYEVLRYDLFGFGKSLPSEEFLNKADRPPVRHYEHAAQIIQHWRQLPPYSDIPFTGVHGNKVVVIGLSRGGATAVDLVLSHPDLVCGIAVIAGGLSGFHAQNLPEEDKIFAQEESLLKAKEAESLAQLTVRIWGDGPLQKQGRSPRTLRRDLYEWCKDIAIRECNGTGGSAIASKDLEPPAVGRLADIKVPVAVALGIFDETYTTAAMRYLGENVNNSTMREFESAHMVNLECNSAFNPWLEMWLNEHEKSNGM